MTRKRKRRIKIVSQTLIKHERRMIDAIKRALTLLAREIDARWVFEHYSLIYESLVTFESRLTSIIFRYGIHVAGESGTSTLQYFGTKSSMEIMMESIRRWLGSYSNQRSQIITSYLRRQIQNQLSGGASDTDIRSAILRIINTKGSADRIARTETHTALEQGAYEAALSLGVRLVKEWALGDNPNHRQDHVIADGQTREINEPFTVGGESLKFPGDPTASAKQIVNCRCTALYHLVINGEIQR